jgi:NADPH-dependent curcumin reductase CurA
MPKTRHWLLDHHPQGPATPDCWRLAEAPMPEPGPGQVLVRTLWLSVDPYMRGRIAPGANYTAGVRPGEVMQGGGVAEVIASRHPDWAPGDLLETMALGWREHAALDPDAPGAQRANRVPPDIPPQAMLGWHGMPGLTAWVGLTEIGRPAPGETLVVSAAAGAVGQVVIQLAVAMGARVVAIAGSAEKLALCRSLGAAAAISHRDPELGAALDAACPAGVDVFFDNTGGPIHDAVLARLATHARVVICGRIAVADKPADQDIGLRASARLIVTRARVQGMVVFDWWHRREAALARLAALHRDGRLRFHEDIVEGFERVPEAFCRMMAGQNLGKQLVRL